MALVEEECLVCGTPTKFLYREYNGFKIRPPRCLGCVMKFPPPGLIFAYQNLRNGRRWIPKYLHHQWAIIAQDKIGEDWFCLRCRKSLSSPGLGYPGTVACNKGTERTLKNVFWATLDMDVRCPKCRRRATLVKDKIAYKYKVTKKHFPFICEYCP